MNDLTKRMFAEGHTPESHPGDVRWNGREFVYTYQRLIRTIWQAPCGVFKKGGSENGYGSYGGVDYRPENNNPRYGCPHLERPCEHRSGKPFFAGENCVFHEATEPYNYKNSLEKERDEDSERHRAAREKLIAENPAAWTCCNLRWNSQKRVFEKRLELQTCISMNCKNTECAITRKPLDPAQVYIEYDVLRTWHTRRGLFEDTRREVTKGLRVFNNSCGKSIAELWIKANGDTVRAKLYPDERRYLRFEKMRKEHPDFFTTPFYPEYDKYEFTATAQNLRLKPKGKNARDLAQDLADIAEGMTVVHASDREKAAAQSKRERKKSRQQQRINRLEKLIADAGFAALEDIDKRRAEKYIDYERICELNEQSRKPKEKPSAITPKFEQLTIM